MVKRLLIVTDSIGAPRNDPEITLYEQTWVYKIKLYAENNGFDVFAITHNGLHSKELLNLTRTKLYLYEPDVVIFQCGIVDCAPRVLKNREILVAKILGLSRPIHYLARKYHSLLSSLRDISLVTTSGFQENLEQINALIKERGAVVVQVPIAPACAGYIEKSPLISRNINDFNAVIRKCSDVYVEKFEKIDSDKIQMMFMSDYHHINIAGHDYLSACVLEELNKLKIFNEN